MTDAIVPAASATALTPFGGLVGTRVTDPGGGTVGSVVEVMLAAAEGRIVYVVLAVGGVAGIGERLFAVPWSAFVVDPVGGALAVRFPAAALDGLDGFRQGRVADRGRRTAGGAVTSPGDIVRLLRASGSIISTDSPCCSTHPISTRTKGSMSSPTRRAGCARSSPSTRPIAVRRRAAAASGTMPTTAPALTDALRLSRGMSYKNAMAGLPMGGGKAVVLAGAAKSDALLEAFGDAVDGLGGRYVTAEDVGMSDADMAVIARRTRHVSGLPVAGGAAGGNPGPSTAEGVFVGMRAAIRHRLGREGFAGIHVAVQGLGSVGGGLAERLAAAGARLTVADLDHARAARLADRLSARHVPVGAIATVAADVFSPNALGAVLDADTIAGLDVAVVAGAANNQLATPADGARIRGARHPLRPRLRDQCRRHHQRRRRISRPRRRGDGRGRHRRDRAAPRCDLCRSRRDRAGDRRRRRRRGAPPDRPLGGDAIGRDGRRSLR